MKRIGGIAIWYWVATAVLVLAGVWWFAAGRKTPEPSEDAVKCFEAGRELLLAERAEVLASWSPRDQVKAKMRAAKLDRDAAQRKFEKMMERLERNEGLLADEKDPISRWMGKGREHMSKLPKTTQELMSSSQGRIDAMDREWQIFMEADLVDVLEKH